MASESNGFRTIRALVNAVGTEPGSDRNVGQEYEVGAAEAERLVEAGQAEFVEGDKEKKPKKK